MKKHIFMRKRVAELEDSVRDIIIENQKIEKRIRALCPHDELYFSPSSSFFGGYDKKCTLCDETVGYAIASEKQEIEENNILRKAEKIKARREKEKRGGA